jgi:hypothetical protein
MGKSAAKRREQPARPELPLGTGITTCAVAVVAIAAACWLSWGAGAAASAAPGGPRRCDPTALVRWIEAAGGELHPSLEIVTTGAGANESRSVHAVAPIGAGEQLYRVPDAIALRGAGSWAPFRAVNLSDAEPRFRLKLIGNPGSSTARVYRLAATLLAERAKGAASRFAPYVACLPGVAAQEGEQAKAEAKVEAEVEAESDQVAVDPALCPAIFCATAKELRILPTSDAVDAKADRAAVRATGRAIDWDLVARENGVELGGATAAAAAAAAAASSAPSSIAPTAARWRWAVAMVISRQFGTAATDDDHVLVPFADLLNHSPDERRWNAANMETPSAWDSRTTAVPVAAGEEVYSRYASAHKGAAAILNAYGFVYEPPAAAVGAIKDAHTTVGHTVETNAQDATHAQKLLRVLTLLAPGRRIAARTAPKKTAVYMEFSLREGATAETLGAARVLSLARTEMLDRYAPGGGLSAADAVAEFATLANRVSEENDSDALAFLGQVLRIAANDGVGWDEETKEAARTPRGQVFMRYRKLRRRVLTAAKWACEAGLECVGERRSAEACAREMAHVASTHVIH